MDAAAAAAMSDPERNPHFRRRWNDPGADTPASMPRPGASAIGTLGLVLQEAMDRRRVERDQAVAANNGDPPR